MSARIASSSLVMLRFRRRLDVDAITIWSGVMVFFLVAAMATLLA